MVFDPFDHIVEITRHITLQPGDVLWMGAESTCQLEPGDTVEVEISGIGVLSNPVHPEGITRHEQGTPLHPSRQLPHHRPRPDRRLVRQGLRMKRIMPKSNTRVVLMTRGNFDLHFTPVEEMERMAPYHFAVEVDDWDDFLEHLKELGIRHTRPIQRPENQSKFCYIHDPDHTMIELVHHAKRPN